MSFYLSNALGFFIQFTPCALMIFLPFPDESLRASRKHVLIGILTGSAIFAALFPLPLLLAPGYDVIGNMEMLAAMALTLAVYFPLVREVPVKKVLVFFIALFYAVSQFWLVNAVWNFLPENQYWGHGPYPALTTLLYAISAVVTLPVMLRCVLRPMGDFIREMEPKEMHREFATAILSTTGFIAALIKNNTATVTIVPAPVTFTVADNIWVIDEDGTPDRSSVTLKPTWGAVTVEPDLAVHHTYPTPGTRIESDLNLTIQYRKDNVTYDEAPTEAGTYEILVTIGNTNFRHSALSDGASHNVGELIVTDNPDSIEKYTVHFDLGYEGAPSDGPADMADLFANQTVVLPPYSGTRQNFLFQGWRYDGRVYLANEEFHMPASDVTFTAEWLDETSVRTVGGTVKREQEDDPSQSDPLYGATVTLKQGSNEIGETSTDANGKFTFENLVPGIYNLEIRYSDGSAEVVETYLVNVEGEDSLNGEYILPSGALNTVVESDVTAVVDLENIVAEASDDGIYTTDDEKTVKDGGTVEFKMTIHSAELTTGQTEEIPVPEDRIGMVLALELTKTVTKNSGDPEKTDIHDAKVPVTTIIHLPAELQGKSSYTVYRFHDMKDEEGSTTLEMQTITTSPNSDGEYLRVIREGTAIELYAEFYSTYVLTWNQNTGVYYSVKLPERVENGSITANYQSALRNSTVTLTAKPDEGYVLGELTVTDKDGNEVALTDHGDGTYSFKMPDGGVTVKVVFKCVGGERCPSRKFADLNVNAWYHEYTDYVITKDLMHGVSGNLFVPEGTVTRAQMVTVLWNMSGKPVVNYYMTYSDVSEGAWYAEAIRWASSEGIAGGYGNNRFGPDDPITREQMAAMLYRYEQRYGNGGFTGDWMYRLPFTDLNKISDWAFEAVAWCNMNGVIKGRDGNVFDPHGYARRNEMAAVLTRYSEMNVK